MFLYLAPAGITDIYHNHLCIDVARLEMRPVPSRFSPHSLQRLHHIPFDCGCISNGHVSALPPSAVCGVETGDYVIPGTADKKGPCIVYIRHASPSGKLVFDTQAPQASAGSTPLCAPGGPALGPQPHTYPHTHTSHTRIPHRGCTDRTHIQVPQTG